MDALEFWDLTFLALGTILVGVALRRRPRFNEGEVTPEDLTRQIEFQWPIAGSSMVFAVYVLLHVFVARVDVVDTIFLSLLSAFCIFKCLLALRQIVRLSRWRRLVLTASASQSPKSDAAE